MTRRRYVPWMGPAVLVLLWAALGLVRHRAIAGPLETMRALVRGLNEGHLLFDITATLARTGAGLVAGLLVGAVGGLALAASPLRARAAEPGLDFLRAIPPLLVLPLFMLGLGYGDGARIATITWAVALAVSLHVAAAARRRRPERLRALVAMGATRWQRLRWLDAYEAIAALFPTLRQAAALALVVSVVSEMVGGADAGLGTAALHAQITYDAPALWAVLVLAGFVGLATSQALLWLERRVVHWEEIS